MSIKLIQIKCLYLETKVTKSQKTIQGLLSSPKKRTKLTILSKEDAQDSEFCSFFGRIKDTINCFQDLLTFTRLYKD